MHITIQFACQFTIATLLAIGQLISLKEGIEGTESKKPGGFGGAIRSVIGTAISIALFYGAGSFSLLIR